MSYFEMSLYHKETGNVEFDISVNEGLYYFFTGHGNSHSMGEDWFDITLNQRDVKVIKELCKTNEEKQLIGKNVREGTIVDILIHRTIKISGE